MQGEETHQDILAVWANTTALKTLFGYNIKLIYIIISEAENKGENSELELTGTQFPNEDWRSQGAALLFGGKTEKHQSHISTSSILLSAPRSEASSLP